MAEGVSNQGGGPDYEIGRAVIRFEADLTDVRAELEKLAQEKVRLTPQTDEDSPSPATESRRTPEAEPADDSPRPQPEPDVSAQDSELERRNSEIMLSMLAKVTDLDEKVSTLSQALDDVLNVLQRIADTLEDQG
jgi:hypothetical protein